MRDTPHDAQSDAPEADAPKAVDPAAIAALVQLLATLIPALIELFKKPKPTPKPATFGGPGVTAAEVKQILDGASTLMRFLGGRVSDPKVASILTALASLGGQDWFVNLVLTIANTKGPALGEADVQGILASLARPPA